MSEGFEDPILNLVNEFLLLNDLLVRYIPHCQQQANLPFVDDLTHYEIGQL